MSKHIWDWDKRSEKPMRVVCIRCKRTELLSRVLNEIGCGGCPVEAVQGRLLSDKRGENRRATAQGIPGLR